MYNSDSVVAFGELLESMGASLMDFGNSGGGQQKQATGTDNILYILVIKMSRCFRSGEQQYQYTK